MKKDTVVKKISAHHTSILDTVHKIRDFIYNLEDPELCDKIDIWCENMETFLDEDGNVDSIIEALDDVFIEEVE